MTAEVAVLNKLGIALAADSAVTISEGADSRKVFNTADKLFELSRSQSIACMVFSNLQFMQAPLQVHSGFETVGGPIDVAVISKSEGLVWVKRKHYFPQELNARFLQRIQGER